MNRLILILLAAASVFPAACRKKLEPAEYIRWVDHPGNGLIREDSSFLFGYQVQFRPHDYMALRELGGQEWSEEAFREADSGYRDLLYFSLKIMSRDKKQDVLRTGITQPEACFERLRYLSEDIRKDLLLVHGEDTLPCVLHHFERTYGVSPVAGMLVAFDPPAPDPKPMTLLFLDRISGSPSFFSFSFGTPELPRLVFSKRFSDKQL